MDSKTRGATRPRRRLAPLLTWLLVVFGPSVAVGAPSTASTSPTVPVQKTPIVALQADARVQAARAADGTAVTLVSLAPEVGQWLLLEVTPKDGTPSVYHLETLEPQTRVELVSPGDAEPILRVDASSGSGTCSPWRGEPDGELSRARATGLPFARLCGGRLNLRNPATGRRSQIEKVTDFLRDRVRGGEKITVFVRDTVFKDRYLQTGTADKGDGEHLSPAGSPPDVELTPRHVGADLPPTGLALALDDVRRGRLEAGRWYTATDVPGVFVSAVQPGQVVGLSTAQQGRAAPLDEVESTALVYLVAFDLSVHEMGFALGTDHPRVVWSERPPASVRDDTKPGPDGLGTIAPLVRTGILPPRRIERVTATFTGGFKRSHGAFKFGELASRNLGSHYGFVESGTVLSRLQPGLATAVVWRDGQTELLTWREELDERLSQVRHARQNGVALVDRDPASGMPRPGALVTRWGEGNWSGSVDQKLRSLRSGLCRIETEDRGFLVYGYFSGATPSAMARVFLAAGCSYALHLDMNALEHTYLALYRAVDGRFLTQHLIDGMEVLDPEKDGGRLPRFVAVPDNRDFFYLTQRNASTQRRAGTR